MKLTAPQDDSYKHLNLITKSLAQISNQTRWIREQDARIDQLSETLELLKDHLLKERKERFKLEKHIGEMKRPWYKKMFKTSDTDSSQN